MACVEVVGGIKAEMKSEAKGVVEIRLDDVFNNESDGEDPFRIDDDNSRFRNIKKDTLGNRKGAKSECGSNSLIEKNKVKNDLIKIKTENDKSDQHFRTQPNLQANEKLVINFSGNEDLLHDSNKDLRKVFETKKKHSYWHNMNQTAVEETPATSTSSNNDLIDPISWSDVYRTVEGTSVKDDIRKVKVTRVPTSYVSSTEYTVEGPDKFRCTHCQHLTNRKKNITKHIRFMHRDVTKIFECPYCPHKAKYNMKYHIISMHKSESELEWFRCDKCDYKSKLKTTLRNHMLTHFDKNQLMERISICDRCHKMFKNKCGLRRHVLFAHEKQKVKKRKCTECGFECIFDLQLKNHTELYHTDYESMETLQCPKCSYSTRFKSKFRGHMNSKHSKNLIQCEKCAYTTHGMERLRLHMIGHKDVKGDEDLKYRCDKCDYKTYRQYSLRVHKLNHLKPEEIVYFYCYHCDFKAKRKDNLKTHVVRHFKHDEVSFQCFMCDFTTKKRQHFTNHIDKHSKGINDMENQTAVDTDSPDQVKNKMSGVGAQAKKQTKVKNNLKIKSLTATNQSIEKGSLKTKLSTATDEAPKEANNLKEEVMPLVDKLENFKEQLIESKKAKLEFISINSNMQEVKGEKSK